MALPIGDGYGSYGSCGEIASISTNTTTTLSPLSRAIYVATDGTLQLLMAYATASTTITVYGGSWLPIRVQAVYAAPAGTFAFW